MDQNIIDDLQNVYRVINLPIIMENIIQCLESILNSHPESLKVKTRNDRNETLKFRGAPYFSVVYILKEKPVILAGNVERNQLNVQTPVIRFLATNEILNKIPVDYKFPYMNSKWTNVAINDHTITFLMQLMETEVQNYFKQQGTSPIKQKKSTSDEPKEPIIPVIACIGGFILMFISISADAVAGVIIAILLVIGSVIALVTGNYKQTDPEMLEKLRKKGWVAAPKGWTPTPENNSNSSFVRPTYGSSIDAVCCPRCGSSQISTDKRGFKIGRAVGVGLATGAIGGVLAGAAGKNKIIITCLKCGHEWRPGI